MSPEAYHLGLLGWPVGHSFSPALHQAALEALGLAGEYRLFPIPHESGLKALVAKLRCGEVQGLNITLPYKTAVLPLVDRLTPAAKAVGAVNTLYLEGDQVSGDNTDAPGFLADLKNQFPALFEEDRKQALVLGAGGAARAVVCALLQEGWQVTVAARRLEQAEALVSSLMPSANRARINEWIEPRCSPFVYSCSIRGRLFAISLIPESHQTTIQILPALVVNATSAGMASQILTSPWPEEIPLPPGAAVYDLVYNPRETALVRQARAVGLPAASGGGMLVEQAALSFERWTGREAPRTIMRQALEKELSK